MKKLFANLSHSPPASIYIQREFAKQNIKRLFLVSIFSLFMLSTIFLLTYMHTQILHIILKTIKDMLFVTFLL